MYPWDERAWRPDRLYAALRSVIETLPEEQPPPDALHDWIAHRSISLALGRAKRAGKVPPKVHVIWTASRPGSEVGKVVGGSMFAAPNFPTFIALSRDLALYEPAGLQLVKTALHEAGHVAGYDSEKAADAFRDRHLVHVLRSLNDALEALPESPPAYIATNPYRLKVDRLGAPVIGGAPAPTTWAGPGRSAGT